MYMDRLIRCFSPMPSVEASVYLLMSNLKTDVANEIHNYLPT